jgi:hypothetical protein
MPHFYFDISDEERRTQDTEGLDFPDLHTARQELMRAIGEITDDIMPDGDRREIVGEIRDETGRTVLSATLSLKVESL